MVSRTSTQRGQTGSSILSDDLTIDWLCTGSGSYSMLQNRHKPHETWAASPKGEREGNLEASNRFHSTHDMPAHKLDYEPASGRARLRGGPVPSAAHLVLCTW